MAAQGRQRKVGLAAERRVSEAFSKGDESRGGSVARGCVGLRGSEGMVLAEEERVLPWAAGVRRQCILDVEESER